MSAGRWLLLGAALLPVAACRDATAVVVDVSTDLPCQQAATVTTTIAGGTVADVDTRPPSAVTTRCDDGSGHVGSMVFVPSGDDRAELAVRVVTATRGKAPESCTDASLAGCIVARRVLHFVPHEVLELPVVMRNACVGVACAAGQTCIAGACVGDAVPDPSACTTAEACGESGMGSGSGSAGSPAEGDHGGDAGGGNSVQGDAPKSDAGGAPGPGGPGGGGGDKKHKG